MKKTALFIASAILLLSFSACSGSGGDSPLPDASPSQTAASQPPKPTGSPVSSADPTPSASPSAPASPDVTSSPSAEPETRQLSAYINGEYHYAEASAYTEQLRSDPALGFTVFCDGSRFSEDFSSNAYRFTRADGESADSVYFEVSLINGASAEELLPSFMDGYIDFTDIEFSSYTPIGEDKISADCAAAYNASQYVEAYLINVDGGTVAVVLSAHSNVSADFLWFRAMLATFSLS